MAKITQRKQTKKSKKGRVDVFTVNDTSVMTGKMKHKQEMARIKSGNPAEVQKTLRTSARAGAVSEVARSQMQNTTKAKSDPYGLNILKDPMNEGSEQGQDKATTDGYTPGNSGVQW